MSCPTESHTLDEFESDSPKYESRQVSGIRKRVSELEIKIYDAVRLKSREEKNDDYKSKIELESLLEQSINNVGFVDSAWGCGCNPECKHIANHKDCIAVGVDHTGFNYSNYDVNGNRVRCDGEQAD